jgi:lambda repressor-like predicted transcriptional regulator
VSWLRHLSELQRERQRQGEEAERAERYGLLSDSDLQKKRAEVEARLEALKRDFPDWDIQTGLASSEIRGLEKEREGIILTLVRRGQFGPGGTRPDHQRNPTATTQQDAPCDQRKAFVMPILEKKGWSVHDWAREAKVDFHTANDYLNGKTTPYRHTRKKLADALGTEVGKLPA